MQKFAQESISFHKSTHEIYFLKVDKGIPKNFWHYSFNFFATIGLIIVGDNSA